MSTNYDNIVQYHKFYHAYIIFFKISQHKYYIYLIIFKVFSDIFMSSSIIFLDPQMCSKVCLLNELGDFINIWEIIDDFEDDAISER